MNSNAVATIPATAPMRFNQAFSLSSFSIRATMAIASDDDCTLTGTPSPNCFALGVNELFVNVLSVDGFESYPQTCHDARNTAGNSSDQPICRESIARIAITASTTRWLFEFSAERSRHKFFSSDFAHRFVTG